LIFEPEIEDSSVRGRLSSRETEARETVAVCEERSATPGLEREDIGRTGLIEAKICFGMRCQLCGSVIHAVTYNWFPELNRALNKVGAVVARIVLRPRISSAIKLSVEAMIAYRCSLNEASTELRIKRGQKKDRLERASVLTLHEEENQRPRLGAGLNPRDSHPEEHGKLVSLFRSLGSNDVDVQAVLVEVVVLPQARIVRRADARAGTNVGPVFCITRRAPGEVVWMRIGDALYIPKRMVSEQGVGVGGS
jgi:hypothetical protein